MILGGRMQMTTGVFFHEKFRGKEWLIIGDKFRNFPKAMRNVLKLPQVKWVVPQKVSEELLLNPDHSLWSSGLGKGPGKFRAQPGIKPGTSRSLAGMGVGCFSYIDIRICDCGRWSSGNTPI